MTPDFYKRLLVFSMLFFSVALFVVAGVIGYKYYKVNDYVCYYGQDPSYVQSNSYTGLQQSNTYRDIKSGVLVNLEDTRCFKTSPDEGFVCPSPKYYKTVYLGNQYVTKADIDPFILQTYIQEAPKGVATKEQYEPVLTANVTKL